jgi:hypothetical protein
MASYKKAAPRRTRRPNQTERDERENGAALIMPDFLVRLLGAERLKSVTNRIVLQHWHD